ncbi:MAG: hypothetical protein ACFB02_00775 [Mastigocoleus sp.]
MFSVIGLYAQVRVPREGLPASGIIENGEATSAAAANAIEELWNDVLFDGSLYGAIANLGVFFALGTLLIFIVQWTREMIDGDVSKSFSDLIWPVLVIVLLANNAKPLAYATKGLREIINQTNQAVLTSTSASIQLQEAYQKVMLRTGEKDFIQGKMSQCDGIADPTQETNCLQQVSQEAEERVEKLDTDWRPDWLKGASNFLNTNIFELVLRAFLMASAHAFQWIIEICLLLTALMGPLAVGGSLLPVGSRAIFAWLTGFFSVGMIKLSFNIIVGLIATMVLKARNEDSLMFAVTIGFLAPILSIGLGAGGGMAVFNSFASMASFGFRTLIKKAINV